MHTGSDDYKLFRLNILMGMMGFQKHIDFFHTSKSKAAEKLVYVDVDGNSASFVLDWTRSSISVVFNRTFARTWDSLDAFLAEIASFIILWLDHPDNKPSTLQDKIPKRSIGATEIIQDLRSGMSGSNIMEKHGLNADQMEIVLAQMVDRGIVMEYELVEFRSRLADVDIKEYICLECRGIQFARLDRCPTCGGAMKGIRRHYKNSGKI